MGSEVTAHLSGIMLGRLFVNGERGFICLRELHRIEDLLSERCKLTSRNASMRGDMHSVAGVVHSGLHGADHICRCKARSTGCTRMTGGRR